MPSKVLEARRSGAPKMQKIDELILAEGIVVSKLHLFKLGY